MKTNRLGIKTTLKKGKSYSESNQQVTRIEVYSQLFEDDLLFQDVTLDTEYKQWQEEQLKKLI